MDIASLNSPVVIALWLVLMGGWIGGPVWAEATVSDPLEIGRRIYEDGVLADGSPLRGLRYGSDTIDGAVAACATCHRRSGLGAVEGDIQVAPVTGKFLYRNRGLALTNMDPRVGKRFNRHHAPYTPDSLALAIRSGKNVAGNAMNPMMPLYELGDADMKALIAYMDQLSALWSPGADASYVHLATVITPEVSSARRDALVKVIEAVVKQKNNTTRLKSDPRGRRHMVSAAEFVLGTERKWDWQLWELSGPPETWGQQLQEHYSKQPVFALASGLTESTFDPIHAFCQREKIPCWFPIVDAPPEDEAFYSLYFSRGVSLEAETLGRFLTDNREKNHTRLVQVYRADAVGEAATRALTKTLGGTKLTIVNRVLKAGGKANLAQALKDVGPNDALMLWLRRDDFSALNALKPVGGAIYVSAQLAGGESAPIPPSWQARARLVYPYELPTRREVSLSVFHSWMKRVGLPLVDEPVQSQAYFAMTYLAETLGEMLDNLHRDYLIERAETMLSRRETIKSNELALKQGVYGVSHGEFGSNESTSIYPHMGLGVGQRFASKGAYIVHWDNSGKIVANTDWLVP